MIGLIAAGALAVAVHLGLGGAVLANARRASGVSDIVLTAIIVIVLVKIIVLGRLAIRRGKAARPADAQGKRPASARHSRPRHGGPT